MNNRFYFFFDYIDIYKVNVNVEIKIYKVNVEKIYKVNVEKIYKVNVLFG